MSHSPAPWSYRKEGVVGDHDRYIDDANGEALMSDTTYYPWCSSNEADWPLIAAAPELLEALKEAVEIIENHTMFDGSKAYAAIAKAEGKLS